jgi:hypothetical protein
LNEPNQIKTIVALQKNGFKSEGSKKSTRLSNKKRDLLVVNVVAVVVDVVDSFPNVVERLDLTSLVISSNFLTGFTFYTFSFEYNFFESLNMINTFFATSKITF